MFFAKGKFILYDDENELEGEPLELLQSTGGFLKLLPSNQRFRVKCRVYLIKVSLVSSIHLIGKFEPSVWLEFGENQIVEKLGNDSTEVLVGKCIEFEAKFPSESQLTISIRNRSFLEGNELIGQTVIDLESRFYSHHYARCGLPKRFEPSGYNAWRDVYLPTQILAKYCKKFGFLPPEFSASKLRKTISIFDANGHLVYESSRRENSRPLSPNSDEDNEFDETHSFLSNKDESSFRHENNVIVEQLALDALNSWQSITKVGLVPEHVETRSLYNPESAPELEQGKVQMWLDIFPIKGHLMPKQVDVSVRKAKKFQLRVVIFKTKDVILDDVDMITGERSSDIYVKGFICDWSNQSQRTDVHYRSLNGQGDFNWRFIFNFEFLPAEEKIVYTQRQKLGFVSVERKARPKITLQCFDSDQLSADDNLGQIELNLCSLIKGAGTEQTCGLKMIKDKKWPRVNLFKKRQHRGWWPFVSDGIKSSLRLTVILKKNRRIFDYLYFLLG